jgi:hypothetical protein
MKDETNRASNEYEVDKIKAWRNISNGEEYLIVWVGYAEWTWSRKKNVMCEEEIRRFDRSCWECSCTKYRTTDRSLLKEHRRSCTVAGLAAIEPVIFGGKSGKQLERVVGFGKAT